MSSTSSRIRESCFNRYSLSNSHGSGNLSGVWAFGGRPLPIGGSGGICAMCGEDFTESVESAQVSRAAPISLLHFHWCWASLSLVIIVRGCPRERAFVWRRSLPRTFRQVSKRTYLAQARSPLRH